VAEEGFWWHLVAGIIRANAEEIGIPPSRRR